MEREQKIASAIIEAIQDGIYVINQDFIIEFMNPAMVNDLGEGVGKMCHQVVHQLDHICPWCRADEVFKGKSLREEIRYPSADKTYDVIHVPLSNSDGTISKLSICRDITLRKEGEEKLEASEKEYENLFNHVGCGVYISSRKGKFLNANQALVDMLGYDNKEDFLSIDIEKDLYMQPEDRAPFQEIIEKEGRVIDYELEFKRKDGNSLFVQLTSHVRLDKDGEIIGYEGIVVDQTARKQMEKKIRAKEEDFKRLFENVGCGVYISSKEGKFLNANQALIEMLGYKNKEEFLRIDIERDLYKNPKMREEFKEKMARDGRVIDFEVEFKRKDGSILPILMAGHARYDEKGVVVGYEGINVDISQRKIMEKELREAFDFANNIVQSSPNAIMAADMTGNIIIWNSAAEETLGYLAEDVIGKINIRQIYPEGMAYKVMKMMRGSGYGGAGRLKAYPMVFVRKDGSLAEGNLSATIIYNAQGKEVASLGSFVDLGERLEMERALRRTQSQLLQAEKLAAMGRLTSQVAHELNNPLYGIMNTLELLKTEIPPENRRRKLLEMALSETLRLSELLRKMLSFSKPDQEEKSEVDINTLIDEILLLHEKQLLENSIQMSFSPTMPLPNIYGSKNQLRQVFINLIKNAMDAMPNGGKLIIESELTKDEVQIEFTDTGIGIQEAHIKKIFDSFFTTKDSVKGVGLGLSVCYGFIKEHGGDIKVKSTPGAGTTFTITFPKYDSVSAES